MIDRKESRDCATPPVCYRQPLPGARAPQEVRRKSRAEIRPRRRKAPCCKLACARRTISPRQKIIRKPLGRWRTSQLRRLPGVHLSPRFPVVCWGPYPVKPGGWAILRTASRLDAFSASPVRTWLPGYAPGGTAHAPAVRPPRSSRTKGGASHPSRCPRRIETELSHDVLNPARVPL